MPYDWKVVGQWHFRTELNKHKFADITLTNKGATRNSTILLELVATGTKSDIDSHINKTPEYMRLLSATEAWTVCQDNFEAAEPPLDDVNVLSFVHDLAWTRVVVYGYWKDSMGCMQTVSKKVVSD